MNEIGPLGFGFGYAVLSVCSLGERIVRATEEVEQDPAAISSEPQSQSGGPAGPSGQGLKPTNPELLRQILEALKK